LFRQFPSLKDEFLDQPYMFLLSRRLRNSLAGGSTLKESFNQWIVGIDAALFLLIGL
jgi:hypothetical protein